MCTVTYLPLENGFIITSNRDEAPDRSPRSISRKEVGADTLAFPQDVRAGGTWIASSASGKVLCLLNGAFEKHAHRPPYRLSRGLMALEYFTFATNLEFIRHFDFQQIEPFTLVLWDGNELAEVRWDVHACLHYKKLNVQQPAIWSSSTLYPPEVRSQRSQLFHEWLRRHEFFDPQEVRSFHSFGKVGDPTNDLVMNRNGVVRTVSITQVICQPQQTRMHYDELLQQTQDEVVMKLS